MYKLFLGVQYLIRRPINLLGTIGVMVAVWAFVVIISVFSGFIREVRSHIRAGAPALTLLDDSLESSYAEIETLLRADPAVASLAPRIKWHGLLFPQKGRNRTPFTHAGDRDTRLTPFFQIIGIDPAKEAEISPLRSRLGWGDPDAGDPVIGAERRVADPERPFWVPPERLPRAETGDFGHVPPGVVIGASRTRYPAARIPMIAGDPVVLASARQRPGGGVKVVKKDFTMSGSFRDDLHREVEDTQALVDIEVLRSVFGHDADDPDSLDVFTEVSITIDDETKADQVAARLNERLRESGNPGAVVTWQQRKATFLTAVEIERGVMKVVLFVFMVVASFLIFTTVSMMVTKKTRDIGVISALGGTRTGVLAIFLISGSAIALIGTLLGLVTGWLSCIYLNPANDWLEQNLGWSLFPKAIYALREIPYDLDWRWMAQVALIAAANALFFSFFPAWRASRLDPVQALRYE